MSLKKLNILLADDDIDDCNFFKEALEALPITTELKTVHDGDELLKYLAENTTQLPHVLFLDINMPRKNGFECLAEIKENEKLKALTVIMLTTSFTRGIDLEDNLKGTLTRMGAAAYIRKPNDFNDLKEVIHQALIKVEEKINTGLEEN